MQRHIPEKQFWLRLFDSVIEDQLDLVDCRWQVRSKEVACNRLVQFRVDAENASTEGHGHFFAGEDLSRLLECGCCDQLLRNKDYQVCLESLDRVRELLHRNICTQVNHIKSAAA